MEIIEHFLPDFKERSSPVQFLVFHCFALPLDEMIACLMTNKISVHYIIDLKGQIIRLVPEDKEAFHVGKGSWRGIGSLNSPSVGVELQHMALGQTPYASEQIESLKFLARDIIVRHQIAPQNVVGHSDVAPTRKPDPGKAFPWSFLAKAGIGLFPKGVGFPCADVAESLKTIGYDTQNLVAAAYAFYRRFMPERVSMDEDIEHLLKNPYPQNTKHPAQDKSFLARLNAVAGAYQDFF